MDCVSTRDQTLRVSLGQALREGLAPDGGLYVPRELPSFVPEDFASLDDLPSIAARLLQPFFAGEPLAPNLSEICREAFNFPVVLLPLARNGHAFHALELFHGPTAAFKDFGARFLAACMVRQPQSPAGVTILVATSGDTGGAVAAAFHGRPGVSVVILFPDGRVSPRQAHQLCCWGGNVAAYRVAGEFDDCQAMVKAALSDRELQARRPLSSANSINIGRLLPQCAYYALTSLQLWRESGRKADFIIPSGNLGNACACLWARAMGLPVGRVVLAHNANLTVPDYIAGKGWQPRPSVATLASAMDVGNPSNMERIRWLYQDENLLRQELTAESVLDPDIRRRIVADHRELGVTWCPHTATAAELHARWVESGTADGQWVVVATAHPAKFEQVVEPLIGATVDLPPALAELLHRPAESSRLAARPAALRAALLGA